MLYKSPSNRNYFFLSFFFSFKKWPNLTTILNNPSLESYNTYCSTCIDHPLFLPTFSKFKSLGNVPQRDSFSPTAIMEEVSLSKYLEMSASNLTPHIKGRNSKWADSHTGMVPGILVSKTCLSTLIL